MKNFNLKFGISNLECEPLELGVAKLISNSKLLISNYSKILHSSLFNLLLDEYEATCDVVEINIVGAC